jgi:mersacidin/lichenicidin family type 2 lantibiotic
MMSNEMIVRAWKDPEFRAQLDAGAFPAHPAGNPQLSPGDLGGELYLTSPPCTDGGPRCSFSDC